MGCYDFSGRDSPLFLFLLLVMTLAALSINFLGDPLRDVLDLREYQGDG